jgi:methylamine dehydrogenase accessory protein MauD
VLWLVVVALCVIVVALARQIGALHLRLGPRGALELDDEGPALGTVPAPAVATDVAGTPRTIGGGGEPQFLLFVSPACPLCDQVMPSVAAVAGQDGMRPYVLVDGDSAATTALARRRRLKAPIVAAADLARHYEVPGTPYVVVLDIEGRVTTKGTVNNLEQMEGLVNTARQRVAAPVEELAPA